MEPGQAKGEVRYCTMTSLTSERLLPPPSAMHHKGNLELHRQSMAGTWALSSEFTFQIDRSCTREARSFLNHAPQQQFPDTGSLRKGETLDRLMLKLFHPVKRNLKAIQDTGKRNVFIVKSVHSEPLKGELITVGKHIAELVLDPDLTKDDEDSFWYVVLETLFVIF